MRSLCFRYRLFLIAVSFGIYLTPLNATDEHPSCKSGIDIVNIVDVSLSARESQIMEQQGKFLAGLIPLSTTLFEDVAFGSVSFSDKPWSSSESDNLNDHCAKVHMTLAPAHLDSELTRVFQKVYITDSAHGNDFADASFDAVYRTLMSNDVGWRDICSNPTPQRVIFVHTDSISHLRGDSFSYFGKYLPPVVKHRSKNSRAFRTFTSINEDCATHDYVHVNDLQIALEKTFAIVVFVVYESKEIIDSKAFREYLVKSFPRNRNKNLVDWYQSTTAPLKDYSFKVFPFIEGFQNVFDYLEEVAPTILKHQCVVTSAKRDSRVFQIQDAFFKDSKDVSISPVEEYDVDFDGRRSFASLSPAERPEEVCFVCHKRGETNVPQACKARIAVQVEALQTL